MFPHKQYCFLVNLQVSVDISIWIWQNALIKGEDYMSKCTQSLSSCFFFFLKADQPPLFPCVSSVNQISSCHRGSTVESFPPHNSATCSAFWAYLCNSPRFCVRDHKTSSRGTFIPQKQIFFLGGVSWERLVWLKADKRCWLCNACVQCWGPYCSFMTASEQTVGGNGVCRAWKHQKLSSNGSTSVQWETVV